MYSVIERGALIKLFRKSLLACIVAGALVMPAHAVTSTEIKQQIDAAIEKQNLAHQIAEYVRSFGEDDSNPAIQFAQEKWAEQQSILIPLYEQYNKAIQEENSKGRYLGRFRISHYCPCSICNGGHSGTASGAPLTPWVSIAVDPSLNIGDITKADEKSVPDFNTMFGGSPCQDFSIAGKQGGLHGHVKAAVIHITP